MTYRRSVRDGNTDYLHGQSSTQSTWHLHFAPHVSLSMVRYRDILLNQVKIQHAFCSHKHLSGRAIESMGLYVRQAFVNTYDENTTADVTGRQERAQANEEAIGGHGKTLRNAAYRGGIKGIYVVDVDHRRQQTFRHQEEAGGGVTLAFQAIQLGIVGSRYVGLRPVVIAPPVEEEGVC